MGIPLNNKDELLSEFFLVNYFLSLHLHFIFLLLPFLSNPPTLPFSFPHLNKWPFYAVRHKLLQFRENSHYTTLQVDDLIVPKWSFCKMIMKEIGIVIHTCMMHVRGLVGNKAKKKAFGGKATRWLAMSRWGGERRERSWHKKGMTQVSLFLGEVHLTVPGLLDQMVAFKPSRQGWYFICFCIFCTKHRNNAQQVLGEFNPWTPCFPLLYWPQLEQKQTNKKEQQQLYCNAFSQTLGKTPS